MARWLAWLTLAWCASATAGSIPGARFEVHWPGLVSTADVVVESSLPDVKHGLRLGNGDIAVSVFGPPGLLTFQVGKNDLWDYRDSMEFRKLRTHQDFLAFYTNSARPPIGTGYLTALDDPWNQDIRQTYLDPAPTIKPAGQIRFRNSSLTETNFNARLSLWNAEAAATLGLRQSADVHAYVSYARDLIVIEYAPGTTQQFDIELARHKDSTGLIHAAPEFGASGRDLWVRYRFPADPLNYPRGFEYVMRARILRGDTVTPAVNTNFATVSQWVWERGTRPTTEGVAVARVTASAPVTVLVSVVTTRDAANPLERARRNLDSAARLPAEELCREHQSFWHDFWRKSFVQLPEQPYLMKHWFFSQYLLACSWRAGRVAPGLFGAWTWEDFPGFGNDYHWDYNMQQAIWGAYSSNHPEQTVPYEEAALALLPTAMKNARDVYGIRGAKFFLSSYPRIYRQNPFPLVHYDQMMSLNAWVAHPFWWRFLYSQDRQYLARRAYPLMKECARFYEAYLTRASDGRYDIWPTAAWDVYLSPHLKLNKNCHMDLAFIKGLMKACVSASELLRTDPSERARWSHIAANLRDYPIANTPEGDVFAPFEGSGQNTYLYPTSTMAIFPGDDIGLHTPGELRDIARRTAQHDVYRGAGEQLLKAMAKVRLGSNELEAYEKVTRETTLPNMGWIIHGWDRNTWVHQCGFPILINESILQSYTGTLRVAPVRLGQPVRFGQLRAVGGFLVSGEIRPDNTAAYLAIQSEAGKRCQLIRPWPGEEPVRVRRFPTRRPVRTVSENGTISFETRKGETYIVDRPKTPWEEQPTLTIGN
ncbi:MAG: hypothetical protein FJ405_04835 [Verrucomicrobia bacterium]|nr:hypothetical protein [Verrucomicrobiota bacterium]